MKLIDLLVQELPKHGGWPEGVALIDQARDGMIFDPTDPVMPYLFDSHLFELADDWDVTQVTREQYEAALAASQPQWNGEGLPPVGCECEFYNGNRYYVRNSSPQDGQKVKVVHHEVSGAGIPCAVFVWIGDDNSVKSEAAQSGLFRPIRSVVERKRDDIANAINEAVDASGTIGHVLYDAIAAGKIHGLCIMY